MEEYRCLLETLSLMVSYDEVFNQIGLRQVAAKSVAVTPTSLFKCYSKLEADAQLYKQSEDCSVRFLEAVTGKLMEERWCSLRTQFEWTYQS